MNAPRSVAEAQSAVFPVHLEAFGDPGDLEFAPRQLGLF
ncbi:hypothetical protein C8J27_11330 [Rhodobacter aestuarii]|uniref:Uncharacterized protein n=1 Tax=Rhodobacter aestuarii TaxID=453582 RepID=A0A1N7QBD4_9RHOB|nr:hypothetical protein C8J27_11330 [Rhodobacter aestuarii]SIT20180.1 hypothetical protein SAMN05421580_11529 [Rhodobacter aestuarii]